MARDSAQFQARSALMGVGYTTSEAEDITSHPVRRRIVLNLMTFGNVSIITGVGGLLLTFINTEAAQTVQRSAVLVVAIVAILAAFHSSVANRLIERLTRWAIARFTSLDVRDYAALLQIEHSYALTEIHVRNGEWLEGQPLSDLHLTKEGWSCWDSTAPTASSWERRPARRLFGTETLCSPMAGSTCCGSWQADQPPSAIASTNKWPPSMIANSEKRTKWGRYR
ncbi:MAG: hypothetical protein ACI8TP_000016 [Acidimicrobiales bacterium]|jgi:hypothetical protein